MLADYTEAAVCRVDDLADGQMKEVRVGDTDVLLARVEGQFYALEPKCTHYQAPLVKGVLSGNRLICPWHNACFDVTNGHRLEAPALNGLPKHEVRIEDDQVLVRLTTNKESLENPMTAPDDANEETYVIVGGGGAGAFAAEGMREGGFGGKIVLLSESPDRPYDRPNCSKDYLQGKAEESWMPLRDEEFYKNYGIELRLGERVTSLNPATKRIGLASGESITYTKAVICPGGKPNSLPVEGSELAGVYPLRSLRDSRTLRELGEKGKRVVIIGSSFIGLEGAMSLKKLGSDVVVVGQEEVPFEKILGGKLGKVVQGWHEKEGIQFQLGRNVVRLEGTEAVEAVVLDNGERIPADLVLLGLGVKPNTDFLEEINIEKDGGITTDEHLKLADDLYAAGDIVHYPTKDGTERIEHWKVAGQQGHVAGLNMASDTPTHNYNQVPFFWTNQQGKRLNYIGHTTKIDEIIYDGDPEKDESFLAFFLQDGNVKAVVGLKRDTDIIAIKELMQVGKMAVSAADLPGADWVTVLKNA